QIQKELGEGEDGKSIELKALGEAITKAGMPKVVRKQAWEELNRLKRMPEASAEYSMARGYIDWLIELPWARRTDDNYDLDAARKVLEADHYGLARIKRRIIEFLAVRKRNPEGHAPILCFVGPPGVG